jgi:hypothetical protein
MLEGWFSKYSLVLKKLEFGNQIQKTWSQA